MGKRKFNIGDKVKIITTSGYESHDLYTVKEIVPDVWRNSGGICYVLSESLGAWRASELRLDNEYHNTIVLKKALGIKDEV